MVVRFGYGLDLKSEEYGRCLQLTLEVLNPMSIRDSRHSMTSIQN